MVKPEIISEKPVTMAETKAALEKIKERDSEFSFRSGKSYDYITGIPIREGAEEAIKKIE